MKKTTKHTPGPWIIPGSSNLVGTENPRRLIAETHGLNSAANARLIAAAPAMLKALKMIDANAAESVEWIRRHTREAIAQAE
jgi:hypothetical protein